MTKFIVIASGHKIKQKPTSRHSFTYICCGCKLLRRTSKVCKHQVENRRSKKPSHERLLYNRIFGCGESKLSLECNIHLNTNNRLLHIAVIRDLLA